jgi:hypothetical protein
MKFDTSLLQAALVGYQGRVNEIELAMADIRRQLKKPAATVLGPVAVAAPKQAAKRKMSAAGRRRIAAAQKKRWAEYNAKKATAAK